MAETIMNVTPAEFSDLQLKSVELSEMGFVSFVRMYYGCELYTSYRVVVRRDVPSIPWFSWGVNRFGPDTQPWGVPARRAEREG